MLQRLTTRKPDDGQIEVAIQAMEGAVAADQGSQTRPQIHASMGVSNGENMGASTGLHGEPGSVEIPDGSKEGHS